MPAVLAAIHPRLETESRAHFLQDVVAFAGCDKHFGAVLLHAAQLFDEPRGRRQSGHIDRAVAIEADKELTHGSPRS
jgi:hypothetical protein